MTALGNLVKKLKKQDNSVTGVRLFEHLKKWPKRTKPFMRDGDYFRISGLGYLCAHEEVLASRHEIVREEILEPGLQITFDIGDRFHDLYRDIYWGPMGEWQGAWECKRCGWDTDKAGLSSPPVMDGSPVKLAKMPEQCPSCGAVRPELCTVCGMPRVVACGYCGDVRDGFSVENEGRTDGVLSFKEWTVKSERLRLRGHPDGWQVVGRKSAIADIKSHGANGFLRRRKVRDGHDIQVWGYQHCSNETKKEGRVLYLNKSPWGDHPAFVKDVAVPFDKRLFDAMVVKPLMALQEGLAGGALPGKVCSTATCPRAKECQLKDICW